MTRIAVVQFPGPDYLLSSAIPESEPNSGISEADVSASMYFRGNTSSSDLDLFRGQRGVEFDLLPWQRQERLPLMAYCPIDQGALAGNRALQGIARTKGVTAAQVALAWVLRQPDVIAIPKAVQAPHLRENLAAASIEPSAAELAGIDAAFPPPTRKRRLAMT